MAKEIKFTDEAREAINIIDSIRKNRGIEEASKYESAVAYIKKTGQVSQSFLKNLRKANSKFTEQ